MFRELFERMTIGRALIFGFTIVAFYYFIMFDDGSIQEAGIATARAEKARIQGEVDQIQKKIDAAREYEKASKELGASVQRLLAYIPEQFRSGQLMKVVSEEARVAGLDISRLTPRMVTDPNRIADFTELGVSIELEGQYGQILNFMSNLTKKKQIFVYDKLELTTRSAGLVKVAADINAFSYNGAPKGSGDDGT